VYKAILEYCALPKEGTMEDNSTGLVIDRQSIFGARIEGSTFQSVRIQKEYRGTKVELLGYVEAEFL